MSSLSYMIALPDGRLVDLRNMIPKDVKLKDIAQSLSCTCRFRGMTRRFYSVAEHCLLMEELAMIKGYPKEVRLGAMMHDMAEAYIGDIPGTIKPHVLYQDYTDVGPSPAEVVERGLMNTICQHFKVPMEIVESKEVKMLDRAMLAIEARQLMFVDDCWGMHYEHIDFKIGNNIDPHPKMRDAFRNRFNHLFLLYHQVTKVEDVL